MITIGHTALKWSGRCAAVVCLMGILLSVSDAAHAWGPATHLYIAQRIFPDASPELLFGAMSADMFDFAIFNRSLKAEFKRMTHGEAERLPACDMRTGLLTHNRYWGADAYAHAYGDPNTTMLYPKRIIKALSKEEDISLHQAEDCIEMILEYMVRRDQGPALAETVRACAQAATPQCEQALVDTYAPLLAERVSGLDRGQAEDAIRLMFCGYRTFLEQYAILMLESDASRDVLVPKMLAAALSVQPDKAERCFRKAVELCSNWREEMEPIAAAIRLKMP